MGGQNGPQADPERSCMELGNRNGGTGSSPSVFALGRTGVLVDRAHPSVFKLMLAIFQLRVIWI
jgi:hypothetical protein